MDHTYTLREFYKEPDLSWPKPESATHLISEATKRAWGAPR